MFSVCAYECRNTVSTRGLHLLDYCVISESQNVVFGFNNHSCKAESVQVWQWFSWNKNICLCRKEVTWSVTHVICLFDQWSRNGAQSSFCVIILFFTFRILKLKMRNVLVLTCHEGLVVYHVFLSLASLSIQTMLNCSSERILQCASAVFCARIQSTVTELVHFWLIALERTNTNEIKSNAR